jgi:amidase
MGAFAWSGFSDTSDYGTVHNPHDLAYLAGGSSSASVSVSAIAVSDCDAALGGDQGGSICIPSAWCGIVELKPTHGLVPYTGMYPLDPTIDHVGPMAADLGTAGEVRSTIAGEELHEGVRLDSRQPWGVSSDDYRAEMSADTNVFTFGVLEEGFG